MVCTLTHTGVCPPIPLHSTLTPQAHSWLFQSLLCIAKEQACHCPYICYEPSLQPCECERYTLVTVQTCTVLYRDNAPHDHAHTSLSCPSQLRSHNCYLAHCSCDHAIAISPSPLQSQSHNQPFAHFRGDYPCCDCMFANCPITSS
jgi:hypothetical protein